MCVGNEGVVLAAGCPRACEKVAVNVERPAHLRQVFSCNDNTKKFSREGLTYSEVDCTQRGYVLIIQWLGSSRLTWT